MGIRPAAVPDLAGTLPPRPIPSPAGPPQAPGVHPAAQRAARLPLMAAERVSGAGWEKTLAVARTLPYVELQHLDGR